MRILPVLVLSIGTLAACQRGELPVEPFPRGDVQEVEVNMEPTYKNQIWFDFGTDSVVKVASKSLWDISFECNDSGRVFLNSALGAKAAPTGSSDFSKPIALGSLKFKPDHSALLPDSLALLHCTLDQQVFVIDRGFDENGTVLGMVKIQFDPLSGDTLRFRFAKTDGSDPTEAMMVRNRDYNIVAYSFTSRQSLFPEPKKGDFDIVFTQYTYTFYDPFTYYLVAGVLTNPYQVKVAVDSLKSFEDFTIDDTTGLKFTNQPDYIGYDWKIYDFGTGSYTVSTRKVFIILDQAGYLYKLHFTGFYSDTGQKGHPRFAYRRL